MTPKNLNSGLNLVAHPKGKPCSGSLYVWWGKSHRPQLYLALQRYRPSPFYAFDEVDMFLDGQM